MRQEIRFHTTRDGISLACASVGEGPPLIKAANWLGHLEYDWNSPVWRHLLLEASAGHRLIRYDERGTGLSDREVDDLSFARWVDDLETVVDGYQLERFALLGISQGGPVAIAYAASHPERVSHLVLCGAFARGWYRRSPSQEVIEERQALEVLTRRGWGAKESAYRRIFTSLFMPDASTDAQDWFDELQRVSATGDNAATLLREFGHIDVRSLLGQVRCPALVLHCEDDRVVPFDEARTLAAGLPDARLVPLRGRNHYLSADESAWPTFVDEVRRFLGEAPGPAARAMPLAATRSLAGAASPAATRPYSDDGRSPRIGQCLAHRYRVERFIGRGGMGEVFEVEDTALDTRVALKTIRGEGPSDEAMARFRRELLLARKVTHRNVCRLYDLGRHDDPVAGATMFLTMELLRGETLGARLERDGPLGLDDAAPLIHQMVAGLQAAHDEGVIHRDFKSNNIILVDADEGTRVVITDFGLARVGPGHGPSDDITREGDAPGTPAYMAPEQLLGAPPTTKIDIYALGVVLYELVTGRRPFSREEVFDLARRPARRAPPPSTLRPQLGPRWDAGILRCLEHDPARRFARVAEVAAALEGTIEVPEGRAP